MNLIIKFLIVISLAISSTVFAHVHLEKSMPADSAMLMKAPEALSLTFSKEVRVVKVSLKNNQGDKINFGFKPVKAASKQFSWSLPQMAPASYTVDIIFLGKDGHKMKESFGFMVH